MDIKLNNQSLTKIDLVKIQTMNLPFELGELSGNYVDSTDRTFGEAMTILGNILPEESLPCFEENISKLVFYFMALRVEYWRCLMSNKSQLFPYFFRSQFKNFEDIINLLTVHITR